jgi:hypothetical protein
MSTLRKVIQEEMSKILKKADDVELSGRGRKDRMKSPDSSREEQWYETKAKNERQVRDKVRDLVAEEYETLREEPKTSINHRSGLRSPDELNPSGNRWWDNADPEKIQEAARVATKKLINEMGGDTFRQRAENTRGFDGLYQIFQDMRRFLPGGEQLLQEIAKAMGRESLEEAITYIARMYDMQDIRRRAKGARSTGDLVELLDQMERLRGTENLIDDLIQQMSNPKLRNMIDQLDRLYIDQMPEYPNI